MDGENNGKPYLKKTDDLGGPPLFSETPILINKSCGNLGVMQFWSGKYR